MTATVDPLTRWQDAYDRLWHRAAAAVPDVTRGLPSPHELRTGQTPDAVAAAALRRQTAREANRRTAERDEARKEITLMGAELDEARTALTEATELLNGTRFGVTPSELLLIEDFLAQQRHPTPTQEAPDA